MNTIPFSKLNGCGNDFILIDNRASVVPEDRLREFTVHVCRRKLSVGADGLILIEPSTNGADFRWRFFNSDGSTAEMCGNGARCAARFAYLHGIAGPEMVFETEVGPIHARMEDRRVLLKMTEPRDLRLDVPLDLDGRRMTVHGVNTGVPHAVVLPNGNEAFDVVETGRRIRYHEAFAPAGANVNFLSQGKDGRWINRTYERGVEDETLACGTGCVAGALILSRVTGHPSPIHLLTRSGGTLTIRFRERDGRYEEVHLEGDARVVYSGHLTEEAWR